MTRRAITAAAAWAALLAVGGAGTWYSLRQTGRATPATSSRQGVTPDVLLVTIDTLRADRVGRGLTPALDALAARGARFTNARTVAPLTLPAHVSLLSGLLPPQHGVRLNGERYSGEAPTLASLARDIGYDTAAFVGAYVLDRAFGLAAGFASYDDQIRRDPSAVTRLEAERPASEVADRAIAWLKARPASASAAPLFLWVHFYDPHAPYTPPAEFRAKAGGQAYDGEVAFADSQLERLLGALGESGRQSRTLVIVAGDHGESLGEHGERTHGMLLYEGALRVPLVVAGPGVPPATRDEPVSLIDVAPTIARAMGMEGPLAMTGVSLLPDDGQSSGERDLYAETLYPQTAGWSALYALTDGRTKLIVSSEAELYDLRRDAGERANLASAREGAVRGMSARLAQLRSDRRGPSPGASGEVAERLRALGYVTGGAGTASPGEDAPNPARVIEAWVRFEDVLAGATSPTSATRLGTLADLARQHPGARVFQSAYARALAESGRSAEAFRLYEQLARRWPADATLFHEMAVAAASAGRLDEAGRAERAALALDPGFAAAHNGLGLLAVRLGRASEARTSFQRAVDADSTNAQYWSNLGNAEREAGNAGAAESAYGRALALEAGYPDAANGLGVLLVQAGRPAEAIALLEAATRAQPEFFEAWLNLGIACQEAGRLPEARAAYERVLRQAPPRFARERQAASALLGRRPTR